MHIVLDGVTKQYGSNVILKDVSLTFPGGQIIAVIGLNGAGKTTLLRCLSGVASPSRGRILMDGERFYRDNLALRRRQMVLPDVPLFLPEHTGIEHVAMILHLYERNAVELEATAMALFAELDLLALVDRPIVTLSRGQAYKIGLAAMLLVNPDLWLIDEPFASGMDPQGIAVFKRHARAAAAAGATVVYSTQILEIAERFADRLIAIDHGGIRLDLGPQDLAGMPFEGPGSLADRLGEFREISE